MPVDAPVTTISPLIARSARGGQEPLAVLLDERRVVGLPAARRERGDRPVAVDLDRDVAGDVRAVGIAPRGGLALVRRRAELGQQCLGGVVADGGRVLVDLL